MSFTIGGETCEIYWGPDGTSHGIRESWPAEGPRAVVHYACPWASRYRVMAALRGGWAAGVRVPPHAYPDSPNLYCLSIGEVEGIKARRGDGGWASYQRAIVPAEYGIPQWDTLASDPAAPLTDPSGKPFTRTRTRASAEVFQPPVGAYYWKAGPDSGKKLSDSTLGLIRPRTEIQVARLFSPYVPLDYARRCMGMVNSKPVRIADTTYEKGTLMLAAMNAGDASDDGNGSGSVEGKTFEVEWTLIGNGYVFTGDGSATQFSPDWNQFMGKDGQWHYVTTKSDGTGDMPYIYTDFWNGLP